MTRTSDMQALQQEAGGMMEVFVVRQADAPELLGQVMAGDLDAARLINALCDALAGVKNAPRRAPMLCGSCPRPLRSIDFSVVLAVPFRADAMRCIYVGICAKCATEHDAIRAKAMGAFRRIWPDARPVAIPTSHAAGHA